MGERKPSADTAQRCRRCDGLRRRALVGVAALVLAAAAACTHQVPSGSGGGSPTASTDPGHASSTAAVDPASSGGPARPTNGVFRREPWLRPVGAHLLGQLRAGSRPSALGVSVLIADKLNNRLIVVDDRGRTRWQFPPPGRTTPGQTLREPDDAFFTPDGRYVIATQEDQAVISVIDVARDRIVFRYGVPGRPGMAADHLHNPDDAMPIAAGKFLTADIMNCRLLIIAIGSHRPQRIIGHTTTACWHHPPRHWGSPNGAFPMGGGRFLVTEINGDWVDAINLSGKVDWSTHPPGVAYPSDSNQIGPDRYLTVDYSQPGQVVIFNRIGHRLWHYRGRGADTLNHPSLAMPLPNGNIILTDDYNHRLIVIDPHTNRIVWQYGHTGAAGRRPGYLNNPDGLDLVPPDSLAITHPASPTR